MDILYENQYQLETKITREYVSLFFRPAKQLFFIASGLCIYSNLVFLLINYVTQRDSVDFLLTNVIFLAVILFSGVFAFVPQIFFLFSKKQPSGSVCFSFGKKIKMVQGDVSQVWDYQNISKAHILKNCIILMFDDNHGIVLSNDGFTVGTCEDFKEFLKDKVDLPEFKLDVIKQKQTKQRLLYAGLAMVPILYGGILSAV